MPSKVNFLRFCLNIFFIGFHLYSEGKLYSSTSLFFLIFAFHIEVTPLANRNYELIQEPDGDISSKAQVNAAKLIEVSNPDSEEFKPTDFINTNKGKPRCIILLFQIITIYYSIYLCI